jgi:hypothetical protein
MGHRQQMTDKQRLEWDINSYKKKLEANKGHNYQYWSEKLEKELTEKGYEWYNFDNNKQATASELKAQEIVEQLRNDGCYARIIAGYEQNVQRTKMFSITYKKKNKKIN